MEKKRVKGHIAEHSLWVIFFYFLLTVEENNDIF